MAAVEERDLWPRTDLRGVRTGLTALVNGFGVPHVLACGEGYRPTDSGALMPHYTPHHDWSVRFRSTAPAPSASSPCHIDQQRDTCVLVKLVAAPTAHTRMRPVLQGL
jgi:hypothetical protein